jgi:PmbA protein
MNPRALMDDILARLLQKGADKVSLSYNASTEEEFNAVYRELNLLRTVNSNRINLAVIKDQKQATKSLNQFDGGSIAQAVEEVMQTVENSNPDPAFDISPRAKGSWSVGDLTPDADRIVFRLQEFIAALKDRYPEVQYDARFTHEHAHNAFLNSNGAWFELQRGSYSFSTLFTSKKDGRMSSMNYTGYAVGDLGRPLLDINYTEDLIRQSTGQIDTLPVPASFTGDVIIAPFLAMGLVETFIASQLGDGGLLMKSSKFPDHLGQRILDPKLTLANDPGHPGLCQRGYFTGDGFLSVTDNVIENGTLKHYPISLYAANKTGKQRSIGPCGNLILAPGETPLREMIASVREGVLCMRASFGQPNANGDLSGVMKNSYYIRDGKLQHPISETMLNGNLTEMLNNVAAISSESFNTGDSIFPYLKISGVYVSRK